MKRMISRMVFLLNPWQWVMGLRRSLTAASVTLLLIGIVSLNIVWGYPWTGLFAACMSLLVVGRLMNYLATPVLHAFVNSPRWVPAGTLLPIPARLSNRGRWPGMDLRIEGRQNCEWVAPSGEIAVMKEVLFRERGIQRLPPIRVDSYFPFYLFRTTCEVDPATSIAVTPAPLLSENDELWRTLESTLKGIATRLSQGAQVHYIGSIEYREGMPVRRWDFSSWARLGKPILREFSTPAARSVSIWIDNACEAISQRGSGWSGQIFTSRDQHDLHPPLERILSLAASSIETLIRNGAAVTLWITPNERLLSLRCEAGGDPSELLISLASLGRVEPVATGDKPYQTWASEIRASSQESLLVLSCRSQAEMGVELPTGTRWITDRTIDVVSHDRTMNVSETA